MATEKHNKYNYNIEDFDSIAVMVFTHYNLLKKEVENVDQQIKHNIDAATKDINQLSSHWKTIYHSIFDKIISHKKGVDVLIKEVKELNINESKKEGVLKKYDAAKEKFDELGKFVNNNIRPQTLLEEIRRDVLEQRVTITDPYEYAALYA